MAQNQNHCLHLSGQAEHSLLHCSKALCSKWLMLWLSPVTVTQAAVHTVCPVVHVKSHNLTSERQ